jgi:hypothetical protein
MRMDALWLLIGILIGWIAAWLLGVKPRARDQAAVSLGSGVARKINARRCLRYHAFRAVVTLVLIGVILTVWSMGAGLQP